MKYSLIPCLFIPFALFSQELSLQSPIRFLALGDSYTIGQGVTVDDRWPVQLIDSLEARGFENEALRIIATTGWRTDNLINGIRNQDLEGGEYNLVSVLIGVNNQYQSRPFSQYVNEFPALIDSAIRYAGGDKSRVFIVSIPDYAYTPFGQGSSDPEEISMELDEYNEFSKHVADSLQIVYFDITPISRLGLQNPSYVASDGLHPSGAQYTEWVKLMLAHIDLQLTNTIALPTDQALKATIDPNPVAESINIAIEELTGEHGGLVRIFNVMGAMVKELQVTSNRTSIPMVDLPDGLYLVRIDIGSKSLSKRVVKKSE
jgi:lysophospholipase L1-like esterase